MTDTRIIQPQPSFPLKGSFLGKVFTLKRAALGFATTVSTSVVLGCLPAPVLSQLTPPQEAGETVPAPAPDSLPAEPETICAYDPNSGSPDPLGDRATLTIESSAGDTAFVYERLPAIVSSDSSNVRSEVDNKRTLTLYETTVDVARQLLIDDSTYYAVLLGLAPDDPFIARGFGLINQTLTCSASQSSDGDTSSELPIPQPSASQLPAPQPVTSQPPVPQPPVQ